MRLIEKNIEFVEGNASYGKYTNWLVKTIDGEYHFLMKTKRKNTSIFEGITITELPKSVRNFIYKHEATRSFSADNIYYTVTWK